jgi:hypothetical protein
MLMKRNILLILFFVINLIGIISCNIITSKKGYNIDLEIREKVWNLNKQLFVSIIENKTEKIYEVFNDSVLKKDKERLNNLIKLLHNKLIKYEFHSLDEYYQKSIFKNSRVEVTFNLPEIREYSLRYNSPTNETMVTNAYIGDLVNRYLVTMIYAKYSGKWKLDYFNYSPLLIEGKDSYAWEIEAVNEIKKGNYVNADMYHKISGLLSRPGGNIWSYTSESEIPDMEQLIHREVGIYHQLPKTIENIKSKPKIVETYAEFMNDSLFPAIVYKTNLPLKDSIAISNECEELNFVINQYFNEFKNDYNTVFIRVVDAIPDEGKSVNWIFIRKKLKPSTSKIPSIISRSAA